VELILGILVNTGDTTGLILVTMPGTYSVNMTGGCGAAQGSIIVSAGEAIPAFTNTRSWLTAIFTNASTNADTYSWDFDDGSTSTDEHPNHLFPATGSYNVCLTATGECGSETTCQTVELSDYVGITENSLSDAVSIYPNPASDVLTINVDNVIGDELTIELSNIAGQVVITRSLSEFNGSAKEDIDVNDLTEGVYFVKVYTNEATTTVRVVVQK
jgi:PKD repeat protein